MLPWNLRGKYKALAFGTKYGFRFRVTERLFRSIVEHVSEGEAADQIAIALVQSEQLKPVPGSKPIHGRRFCSMIVCRYYLAILKKFTSNENELYRCLDMVEDVLIEDTGFIASGLLRQCQTIKTRRPVQSEKIGYRKGWTE